MRYAKKKKKTVMPPSGNIFSAHIFLHLLPHLESSAVSITPEVSPSLAQQVARFLFLQLGNLDASSQILATKTEISALASVLLRRPYCYYFN